MQSATYKIKASELNDNFIRDLKDDFGNLADLEIKVYPPGSHPGMTEERFWEIIDLLNWEETENPKIVEPLIVELTKLPARQLYEFQDILSEKLYRLDCKKYALHIGKSSWKENRHFSSDHFLDVRACVVANGKTYYNHVLQNPQDMPKDLYFESLLYVVPKAWKRKTGKEFSYLPAFDYQTFANETGWIDQ